MKKQEYIEKYGEEAYLEYRKRKTASHRKWCEANREKVINDKREYYKNNPDRVKLWAKKSRAAHKEEISARNKKWRESNPDKVRENYIKFREANPDYDKIHSKKYYEAHKELCNSIKKEWERNNPQKVRAHSLAKSYKRNDRQSDLDVSQNIDTKWIIENVFLSKCIYCGDDNWEHLGCDRIDNSKPHTADNVVCSCFICNADRADRYSVEEFKQYRALHPRACDIPKGPSIELSTNGAIKKKVILSPC